MKKDDRNFSFLVIEDNPGDQLLIEEYLQERIFAPHIIVAGTLEAARQELSKENQEFEVVFLDLSLPDGSGEKLIQAVLDSAEDIPVIVLTGYQDFEFSLRTIGMGVTDYLLKDELNGTALYKTILYTLERRKALAELTESQQRYSDLFHLSPLPMWVYDQVTKAFLDVNRSACTHYGYSEKEFLSKTLYDIRPPEERDELDQKLAEPHEDTGSTGVVIHQKKDGSLINVELSYANIEFKDRPARLILVNDITEKLRYTQAIEAQNRRLRDIAWIQSHVVRAPLARILGLIHLIDVDLITSPQEYQNTLELIKASSQELDQVISDIVANTQQENLDRD